MGVHTTPPGFPSTPHCSHSPTPISKAHARVHSPSIELKIAAHQYLQPSAHQPLGAAAGALGWKPQAGRGPREAEGCGLMDAPQPRTTGLPCWDVATPCTPQEHLLRPVHGWNFSRQSPSWQIRHGPALASASPQEPEGDTVLKADDSIITQSRKGCHSLKSKNKSSLPAPWST